MKNYLLLLPLLTLFTIGCSNDKFKVKGEVYGGEEKMMLLEKPDFHGSWTVLDSVHINKNGGFSFSFPAPMSPEIYRLSLNNRFIYLPVDSVETITLTTSFDKFGTDFTLSGSPNAEKLARFEKDLQSSYTTDQDSLEDFKKRVYSEYLKDAGGSILSFYILTKTVDGKPLYNPSNPTDRKYFGAVATGFKELRPDDPHTALLEQTALQALRQKNSEQGKVIEIEANEIKLIDINLPDENSRYVKLSDVAGKGKKTVVVFSLLNLPESPEFNIELAKVYNRYKNDVEFYNVSLDEDQYTWREAAKNLPWITVFSPGGTQSQVVTDYNLYQLPSFFIYNQDGELVKRPMTLDELNNSL